MTQDQARLIKRLAACRYAPATSEKRFVREMAMKPIEYELSQKQLEWLDRIKHRYRKQLAAQLPPNPDAKP